MSKMNALSLEEQNSVYDEYVESERNALRFEGADEYRLELIRMIKSELSWNNQSEGFIGGLNWVLDKLHGVDRI